MMNTPAPTQAQLTPSSFTPAPMSLVQRKCACGGSASLSGECEDCHKEKLMGNSASLIQPKLKISQPNDKYEQEADRVADEVMRMPEPNVQRQIGSKEEKEDEIIQMKPVSDQITPLVQRQVSDEDEEEQAQLKPLSKNVVIQRQNTETNPEFKPKSNQEQAKEALKKAGEAFLKTKLGGEIVNKGKDFISTLPGTVITGSAAVGTVTALVATNKELPIQAPAIPLDRLHPGLSVRFTLEGPLRSPTKAMISFSGKFGLPAHGRKKPAKTEAEKLREENAHRQLEQFESLKTPEEKAREQRRIAALLASRMGKPTPSPSSLSFGAAGQQLGFEQPSPLTTDEPKAGGPFAPPDVKITPEAEMKEEEPKKKEEGEVMRKASSNAHIASTVVHDALRSSAHPLDTNTRAFMESRFGFDFSHVRIHTGTKAVESARAVNGLGYTVGRDVVFNSGQYSPNTNEGRRLIAHELTHVMQQSGGRTLFSKAKNREYTIPDSQEVSAESPKFAHNMRYGVGHRFHLASRSIQRAPASTPTVSPSNLVTTICPNCVCDSQEIGSLEVARTKAQEVLSIAATSMDGKLDAEAFRDLFESEFGSGSATPTNITGIKNKLTAAAAFLGGSSVGTNIHCDDNNTQPSCPGVTAFYENRHIIFCTQNPSTAQMLKPGEAERVKDVTKTKQTSPPAFQQPGGIAAGGTTIETETDVKATEEKQRAANKEWKEKFEAIATRVMSHEAIHHAIRPGTIDIYKDERLSKFLGTGSLKRRKEVSRELSSASLKNPDSIVAFAFRTLEPLGKSKVLPQAQSAIKKTEMVSSKLSIRPLFGRFSMELAFSVAQEALEQTQELISDFTERVNIWNQYHGERSWTAFESHFKSLDKDLVAVLQNQRVPNLSIPDARAQTELESIDNLLKLIVGDLRNPDKRAVIDRFRRVAPGRKNRRIGFKVEFGFNKLSRTEQVLVFLRQMLNRDRTAQRLVNVVLEVARTRGGFGSFLK